MASEIGRGAQVRLDGPIRQLARGGNTQRLLENIRQKQALENTGSGADGDAPDGAGFDGTAALDEVLQPGGAATTTNFGEVLLTWFNTLPTTLPATAGEFWNNGNTLALS